MDYTNYEIREIAGKNEEYELIMYVEAPLEEFASEYDRILNDKAKLMTMAKEIINTRYASVRVTMLKVVIGGMAMISAPLMMEHTSKAKAAEIVMKDATEKKTSSSIYYAVEPGDTLWQLSQKFNTSIDNIKKANHMTTDVLQINQQLIIPKAFHVVQTGDYLTVLAKEYGITVDAIKAANGMTTDQTQLGQTLIIPALVNASTSTTTVPQTSSPTATPQQTTYTVVSGDSLWAIATKFNISLDALRSANHITNDRLFVGQSLIIPQSTPASTIQNTAPSTSSTYTVVSGDSLSVIAKKYNVTVDQIKQANHLTSDVIRVGQVLTLPTATTPTTASTASADLQAVQKDLQTLGYYTVTTMTGSYDNPTTEALKNVQKDYGLPVTGTADQATKTVIAHALVKHDLVKDTKNYLGVPYLWGGTTPKGFDCSGFVYYMFNQHGVSMSRNTSAGLYTTGTAVSSAQLQPGDLVFFAVNTPGTISHVGFYIGNNQFVSATSSSGIAIASMDNSYWKKYYVGAKRVY
ncbi:peptidoglycan endopeptidase LytF [Pullulanibacillus camelliae]|uniref:Peptidoglycan endopeptidase LytF n=2 Tax=Pullulanibacillus camelliae TaxID=1707096 RepID=A0A8J2YP85_9BACL|nr:LysM peptidoglycan-binding domain-containing protein [Pullulanibacillus camelliae]GGE57073.1 peptidoglycan endopeptidase LytF [Pullulanibacillus camelliae]